MNEPILRQHQLDIQRAFLELPGFVLMGALVTENTSIVLKRIPRYILAQRSPNSPKFSPSFLTCSHECLT